MHIKKILSQYRRDFEAIYACEHCEHEHKSTGYDDSYFHSEAVPKMACPSCGKEAGPDYRPLTTKYDDSQTI